MATINIPGKVIHFYDLPVGPRSVDKVLALVELNRAEFHAIIEPVQRDYDIITLADEIYFLRRQLSIYLENKSK